MKSKILSAIIAATYLIVAYIEAGNEGIMIAIYFLILPLASIWFSDAMGRFTGMGLGLMGGPAIDKSTPGCVVAFVGWLLLLVPVIMILVVRLSGSG